MSRDDNGIDAPPDAPAPDMAGFNMPLSAMRGLYERARAGDVTLTFFDGVRIVYAIGERLRDDLQEVALGNTDADIGVIAELTSMAFHLACPTTPEDL